MPQHSFVGGNYEKPLRRGLSNIRRIASGRGLSSQARGKPRTRAQRLRLPRSPPHRTARCGVHAFPFSKPTGCKVLCGVGYQSRRQAGHGAAHSLATYLEAAELIPRIYSQNRRGFNNQRMRKICLCAAPAHVHSARAAFLLLEHSLHPHPARSADWPHAPCLALAPCIPKSNS